MEPSMIGVFTTVTVLAPTGRLDVALPADVALSDLMPVLLDMTGTDSVTPPASGWCVSRLGGPELDAAATLDAHDVVDGELLQLRVRSAARSMPVFDEVADAVASTVTDSAIRVPIARVAGLLLTALSMSLAALFLAGWADRSLALEWGFGGAVLLIALAAVVAHAGSDPATGAVISWAAVALAAAGGSRIGEAEVAQRILPCAVAALVVAVIALLAIGGRVATMLLSAVASGAAIAAVAAVIIVVWSVPPEPVAAGIAAFGMLGSLLIPTVAGRLAGLPRPLVPTTGSELAEEPDPDYQAILMRGRQAGDIASGLTVGCYGAAAIACWLLAPRGDTPGMLLAAVTAALLLLQCRTLTRVPQVLTALCAGCAATLAVLTGLLRTLPAEDTVWVLAVLVVLALLAVVVAAVLPRRKPSPIARRWLSRLDRLLIVALLPLAAWAMSLFEVFRHL